MKLLQQIRRITYQILMCERKVWQSQEDRILKQLYEQKRIRKWSQISKQMGELYGMHGRSSKQCRERYHNHLKTGINKDKWTRQEQLKLIQLHTLYGNKWALISKLIKGRTQNCVKNMLYSKMRKSIRQLNRFTYCFYRRQLNQIKVSFIYRLIEFTEKSYRKEEDQRTSEQNISIKIKNQILRLTFIDQADEINTSQKQDIKKLIQQIHQFKKIEQKCRVRTGKKNKRRNTSAAHTDEEFTIKDKIMINKQKNQVEIAAQSQQKPRLCENYQNNITYNNDTPKIEFTDTNMPFFQINNDLENPIQTDNQFCRARAPNIEDWAGLTNLPSYHSIHD